MAQPLWITPAGSLGVIPETKSYTNALVAQDPDSNPITYRVISGTLPAGMQFSTTGLLTGTPYAVNENIISKFTVRAATQTLPPRIADRTFSITVTGNDIPVWTTPAGMIGNYYENSYVDFQFEWSDNDPSDPIAVSLAAGELPGGLVLYPNGRLVGHIQPVQDLNAIPGYGNTGQDQEPYDFIFQSVSKNYEFTLEVSDGKNSDLRTFTMYVASRESLTADTTVYLASTTYITADETPMLSPFIVNTEPSNIGTTRSDNYFAYQFIGESYSGMPLKYAIAVNQGFGSAPGLILDTNTGWYYGYIPDQGATETTYSFTIAAYQSEYIGDPIACTATTVSTNAITCNSTVQIEPGQPLIFSGTGIGGITAAENQIYYVNTVLSPTKFTVTLVPGSGVPVTLTSETGSMTAHLVLASDPYPFTVTVTGSIDALTTWLTDTDLGTINNGDTSTLSVEAVNQGGRTLEYRLASGDYNLLPQGLQLLPTGEIAGRVSFNTFSLDMGATTFDETFQVTRNTTIGETTFDLEFEFTVNAYAPETTIDIYKVSRINVDYGGINYSLTNLPVLAFNTPIGSSAVQAVAGEPVIVNGSIAYVPLAAAGNGYTLDNPATLGILEGYGGTGAVFTVEMTKSGTRDVVSVYKTFRLRLNRKYNKPYQNLLIQAMPPQPDRDMIASLLDDPDIFIPDWIYRPTDPNFGVAKNITYAHAYCLNPVTYQAYVESLQLNHYWKNLVLGNIGTAQAVDANGNVIYEVVYSRIIDDLVNNDGESVGKIVNLPYEIRNGTITQVYPNALADMRQQVINEVGLVDNDVPLPLWMTSTQSDGTVTGFIPAWVIAYTKPGRSKAIAYYIQSEFNGNLNDVDFEVDRYVLDSALTAHWNPTGTYISAHNANPVNDILVGPGVWGPPTPSLLTTFDIYENPPYNYIGQVDLATDMAFIDINGRTVNQINAMGGLDGITGIIDGSTLIFAKQEDYFPLPGNYPVWTSTLYWPDSVTVTYGTFYYFAIRNVPIGIDISNMYYWQRIPNIDAAWQIQSPFDPLVRTSPDYYPIQSQTPNGIPSVWVDLLSYQVYYPPDNVYPYEGQDYQYQVSGIYEGAPDPLDGEPGSYDTTPFSQATIVPGGDRIECYQTYAATGIIRCDSTLKLGPGEQVTFSDEVIGGLEKVVTASNLVVGRIYHILDLGDTNWNTVAGTSGITYFEGQTIVVASSGTGTGTAQPIYFVKTIINSQLFTLSYVPNGPRVTLTNDTGVMVGDAANQRMGIWTITVDSSNIVRLVFTAQTSENEYVTVARGNYYRGAQLYYPSAPGPGLTRVSWLPVIDTLGVQTTFDQNSMQFIDVVDNYNPGDRYDKYLVFPKRNILE